MTMTTGLKRPCFDVLALQRDHIQHKQCPPACTWNFLRCFLAMPALSQCVRAPLSPCSCATAVLCCAGSLARTCPGDKYCCAQPVRAWDCANGVFLSFRSLRFVGFKYVSAGFSGFFFFFWMGIQLKAMPAAPAPGAGVN